MIAKKKVLCSLGSLFVAGLLPLDAARAVSILSTDAWAWISADQAGIVAQDRDLTAPTGNVSAAASGTVAFGPYEGSAAASLNASDYGELRMSGAATMKGAGQADGRSIINVTDTLTLSSAGVTGAGLMTVTLLIDGALASANNATSNVSSRFQYTLSTREGGVSTPRLNNFARYDDLGASISQQCQRLGLSTTSQAGDCFGTFSFDIPFTFGTEFDLLIQFQGNASANTNAVLTHIGEASYDLANSVYWGGISNVRANGQTLTSFDLQSDSGYDWRMSSIPNGGTAPEPGTLALLGLGLASLAATRRRKQ
jgi:hypothetical protein